MKIYITRHSLTAWNEEKRLQGWKDSPLTKQGKEDALKLGEYMKTIHIDQVYSSPLLRAKSTARLIFKNENIIEDSRLKEMNFGDYEGEYIQGKGCYSEKWYAHGYGRTYYDNGKLEYEGNFVYGSPHGYGEYYYANGQVRWKGVFQATVGIEVLKLWKSSLGYVDRRGRIKYGEYYDKEGKLIHYGNFDWKGNPVSE